MKYYSDGVQQRQQSSPATSVQAVLLLKMQTDPFATFLAPDETYFNFTFSPIQTFSFVFLAMH